VAYDHTDKDCLTVFELTAVLQAFKERINNGRPIDVMAFDACLPGSIEALYQLRGVCDILIGSADTLPLQGFPYGSILAEMRGVAPVDASSMAAAFRRAGMRDMGYWQTKPVDQAMFALEQLWLQVLAAEKEGLAVPLAKIQEYGGKKRYWSLPLMIDRLARAPGGKRELADHQVPGS
jgi:hypothetical protein